VGGLSHLRPNVVSPFRVPLAVVCSLNSLWGSGTGCLGQLTFCWFGGHCSGGGEGAGIVVGLARFVGLIFFSVLFQFLPAGDILLSWQTRSALRESTAWGVVFLAAAVRRFSCMPRHWNLRCFGKRPPHAAPFEYCCK
jgi:hypothetical protein